MLLFLVSSLTCDGVPQDDEELSFKEGEEITVIRQSQDAGWLLAENKAGRRGLVPETHLKKV